MSEEAKSRGTFSRAAEDKASQKVQDSTIQRWIIHYLKPYKQKILMLIVVSLFHGLIDLSETVLHLIVIDYILIPGYFISLYWWVPLFLSLLVLHAIVHTQQLNLGAIIGNNVTAALRIDMTDHIQKISLRYFSEGETGRVMSRVTNDVEVLNQFADRSASSIQAFSGLFGIIIILFVLNWKLLLLSIAVSLLAVWLIGVLGRFSRKANRSVRARLGGLTSNLQENISGIKTIKAFQREKGTLNLFKVANNEYFVSNLKAARISTLMEPATDMVRGLSVAVLLFFGAIFITSGQLTVGELVAFLEFTVWERQNISFLARAYDAYTAAMASSERIYDLQKTTPEVKELPKDELVELPPFENEIRFENVTFGYDPENPTLQNINFIIHRNEKLAIVGPTGSGKSTLTNLLFRFYDPQRGRITIDGTDIRTVSLQSLRKQMGIVLQDSFLFEDTILENIRYGKPDATDEEVIKASKVVNADKFIMKLSSGYNTRIEESSSNISIGQRQLISFARTLLTNPRILILDEATSSVDPYTELYIQDALKRLLENRTAIIIAHRLTTVTMADEICVLDRGKIVEKATHQELMVKGGLYSTFYKMQSELARE